jgi:hypothetical protein
LGYKNGRRKTELKMINVIQLSNGEYYLPMKRFYSYQEIQIFEKQRELIKDVIKVEEVKGKSKRLFEDGDLGEGGVCNNEGPES